MQQWGKKRNEKSMNEQGENKVNTIKSEQVVYTLRKGHSPYFTLITEDYLPTHQQVIQ